MKKLVQNILGKLARRVIKKHKPLIISITGSVGKTTTKEAISLVLKDYKYVRSSKGNLNNEFGLPLSILDLKPAHNPLQWLLVVIKAFYISYFLSKFPEILILEMGIDQPGDMNYLTKIAPPTIAIETGVETVHLEFFEKIENLIKEKESLLDSLPENGLALINYDNVHSKEMSERHPEVKFVSYGLNQNADIRASDIQSTLEGTSFSLWISNDRAGDVSMPILGKHHVYNILPALYLAQHFEISLDQVVNSLKKFTLPPGRLTVIPGINESTLLDSSYNAEPGSMVASLDTLHHLPAKRKVAILGDMLELGPISLEAHQAIAKKLIGITELAIFIGKEMEGAYKHLKEENISKLSYFYFPDPLEAIDFIKGKIKAGDLILVKGSQGARTEHITKALMKNQEDASKLLVRQSKEWLNR